MSGHKDITCQVNVWPQWRNMKSHGLVTKHVKWESDQNNNTCEVKVLPHNITFELNKNWSVLNDIIFEVMVLPQWQNINGCGLVKITLHVRYWSGHNDVTSEVMVSQQRQKYDVMVWPKLHNLGCDRLTTMPLPVGWYSGQKDMKCNDSLAAITQQVGW